MTTHLEQRFLELWNLKEGWLDGAGKALAPVALLRAEAILNQLQSYPELPRAYIYPMECGGVQVEWNYRNWGVELQILDQVIISAYYLSHTSMDKVRKDRELVINNFESKKAAKEIIKFFRELP